MNSCGQDDVRRPFAAPATRRLGGILFLLAMTSPQPVMGQESVVDVLSFLLTNRSIATSDPARDNTASTAARDTISHFLLTELSTLPTISSSTGFTYRVDPELGGAVVRSSNNFGPFFTERSLTTGTLDPAFHVAYQEATFDRIDGRHLRDGNLLAIGSRLRGDSEPFDVETLTLHLRTRTVILSANVGLTDRLDLSATLPLVQLTLRGERVDTLRGVQFIQATARADASGIGDVVLSAKYNLLRRGGGGLTVGAATTLATGASDNLLGAGETSLRPTFIGSLERDRVAVHGEVGYSTGGVSEEFDYGGAVTVVGSPRLTLVGELIGRRLESGGRLTELVTPHPSLVGVETIRLTGVATATHRAMAVAGVKWNVAATWLLTVSVARPLTTAGLTAPIIPSIVLEYSSGR